GVDYIIKDTNYADMHVGDALSIPIGVVAQSASGVIPQGEQVTLYTSIPLAYIYSIGCNLNSEGVLVFDIKVSDCLKTIAYIDVTLTFVDETFEPIYDNNGDIYEQSLKISGPLEVDKYHLGHWEFVVSDPEIYAFHIDKMEIICTDGTKQAITFAWANFMCINKSSD
ncbi:MAG: hypothetical protein IKZ16_00505, partial [Clostridia bacterium]|nr:hypothetical protein [Clostridia bacterium]